MLAFYEEIGCEMKTLAKVCELAHWSYEELMGLLWKKMHCTADGGGGYKAVSIAHAPPHTTPTPPDPP